MNRIAKFAAVIMTAMLASAAAWAQSSTPSPDASFAPFEQWMGAVLTSDAATLKALYSTDPAAQVRVKTVMHPADADTDFWLGMKVRTMKVELVRLIVRPDKASIIFRADVVPGQPNAQPISVTDDQYWMKQGDHWRLVGVERTDAPALKQPADMKKDLYPANADAHAEIKKHRNGRRRRTSGCCWSLVRTGASIATCSIWPSIDRKWLRLSPQITK